MWNIDKIPCITTKRLILNEIETEDIPNYNAIVLDRERNEFWGYDDIAGVEGEITENSFFNIVREDFKNRDCLNFAIRLKPKENLSTSNKQPIKCEDDCLLIKGEANRLEMIGEAVLYDFKDNQGELGLRISSDYAGFGLGVEGFYGVLKWALETDFLDKVVAKCFKGNKPSFKMLSCGMDFVGRDDTFYFFKKEKGK